MRIIKDFINRFLKNSTDDQPWLSYYNKDDNTIKITDKCIGCSACSRQCPAGAISGELKKKFDIDQEKCVKCGKCIETCRFGAIVKE